MVGIAVVVVLALVAGVAVFVIHRRSSSPDEPVAVRLVAAMIGADPFTPSAAVVSPVGFRTGARVASAPGGAVPDGPTVMRVSATSGSKSGLYGSTASGDRTANCKAKTLLAALDADPKAAVPGPSCRGSGWDQIGSALDRLTPVVLGRDTLVTNTAYRKGVARRFAAVLQAGGTAVYVDASGVPRVGARGNPLLPPQVPDRRHRRFVDGGDGDLHRTGLVRLPAGRGHAGAPRVEAPGTFATIDIESRKPVEVPTGAAPRTVRLDGLLQLDDEGVYVVADDGERTQVVDHPVAAAFDDGDGGLVYQDLRTTEDGSTTALLSGYPPASAAEATIWTHKAGRETDGDRVVGTSPDPGPAYWGPGRWGSVTSPSTARSITTRRRISAPSPAT